MTPEEEKKLKQLAAIANAHWEQRLKKRQEQATKANEPSQGQIAAPQAAQAKNTICKKQKLQLRKYLIGGEDNQNYDMLATTDSFVPLESGEIVYVGCLPWVVVGEIPQRGERVEVTA